ncbi:MAG: PqqD family protein [Lysobacterales bacterium]
MDPNQTITVASHVTFQQVGDETVLLNLASGQYFGLNTVGTRIWKLLAEGHNRGQICQSIAAEFSAPMADIERDTDALLAALLEHGLIQQPTAIQPQS